MSNRIFQGLVHQMRDAVGRTLGVIDETGTIIACSELSKIGESRQRIREEIAYYNYPGTISAMAHTCLNYIKGKNSCSGKVVSNVKRIHYFLENYTQKKDYKDCIYIKDEVFRNELILLKKESQTLDIDNNLESCFNNFLSIAKENVNCFKPTSYANYILESFVIASFKRRETIFSF